MRSDLADICFFCYGAIWFFMYSNYSIIELQTEFSTSAVYTIYAIYYLLCVNYTYISHFDWTVQLDFIAQQQAQPILSHINGGRLLVQALEPVDELLRTWR